MAFLLQPLRVRAMNLSNRLVMPPMATAKAEPDGRANQAVLDYYTAKSSGGYIGLIIIEHSFVCMQGKAHRSQLSVAEDGMAGGLRELSDVIHANGSKCAMQINHAGTAAVSEVTGETPVGPSAVDNPRKAHGLPHELSKNEIAGIVTTFRDAAIRVKEAGFDAVEIHGAHGYLLSQFFSPLSNKRTDEYGGSVLNRVRIHLEVIGAIRNAVGPDFPILLRFGASDYMEGGADLADSLAAAPAFEKAGVDILDISGGFNGYSVADTEGVQGFFAPLTRAIKSVVSIPVILTGGVRDAQAAEQLLAEGEADLIGVGRSVYKDSKWAKRAVESLDDLSGHNQNREERQ